MIKINKGVEPLEWTAQKATPGFTEFESIPELREALLEEQGYICAYCMRRIPVRDINSNASSKIEHILSQEHRPDLDKMYSNMAVCCPGNLYNERHCDTLKGGNSVSFNLHTLALSQSISYKTKDGTIESSRVDWNTEMKDYLNLNHPFLKSNRKDTLAGVVAAIDSSGWDPAFIRKKFKDYSEKNAQGKMEEYCGIVLWYLGKKIAQLP